MNENITTGNQNNTVANYTITRVFRNKQAPSELLKNEIIRMEKSMESIDKGVASALYYKQ